MSDVKITISQTILAIIQEQYDLTPEDSEKYL